MSYTEDPTTTPTSEPVKPPYTPFVPFRLEAVIVCDKYHDFLAQTLPLNKHLFDHLVVVTSYEDRETQKVCEHHEVHCHRTDRLESRLGHFRKGNGINDGLEQLSRSNWVIHMDADMVLPPQTRQLIQNADLDKSMIYGIDRFIVKGYEAWEEFQHRPRLQHEAKAYIHVDSGFPVGTRIMAQEGYVPIGFFQLWNPTVSGVQQYPEGHSNAGREDYMFGKSWPRNKRGFLPEIIGYHLESHDSSMAANWAGRKTAPFERRKKSK